MYNKQAQKSLIMHSFETIIDELKKEQTEDEKIANIKDFAKGFIIISGLMDPLGKYLDAATKRLDDE